MQTSFMDSIDKKLYSSSDSTPFMDLLIEFKKRAEMQTSFMGSIDKKPYSSSDSTPFMDLLIEPKKRAEMPTSFMGSIDKKPYSSSDSTPFMENNVMDPSIERKKRSGFFRAFKSQSFPRMARENKSSTTSSSYGRHSSPQSYTSLKDLIPPLSKFQGQRNFWLRKLEAESVQTIPISNLLVQKAAWAYLQPNPVSTTPTRSGKCSLRRVWDGLTPLVDCCISFINRYIIMAVRHTFGGLTGATHEVGSASGRR